MLQTSRIIKSETIATCLVSIFLFFHSPDLSFELPLSMLLLLLLLTIATCLFSLAFVYPIEIQSLQRWLKQRFSARPPPWRVYRWTKTAPHGMERMDNYISQDEEKKLLAVFDNATWGKSAGRRVQQYGFQFDFSKRAQSTLSASQGAVATAHLYAPAGEEGVVWTPFPAELIALAERLVADGHLEIFPRQCIVNEYRGSTGIRRHIDRKSFGPTVVGISLGAPCVVNMLATPHQDTKARQDLHVEEDASHDLPSPALSAPLAWWHWRAFRHRFLPYFLGCYESILPPRSLWILAADSRYSWQHEIAFGTEYRFQDGSVLRRPSDYRRVSITFRTVDAALQPDKVA